jgi:hypothetical protein
MLALSKGSNKVGIPPPQLKMETDPFSERLCFKVSRIPVYEQTAKKRKAIRRSMNY